MDKRKKVDVTKLSEATLDYINQKPNFIRMHTIDIDSNEGILKDIRLNQKWCD